MKFLCLCHCIAAFAITASWACQAFAEEPKGLLRTMAGTWDVQQRMWPAPGAAAIALPPAIAQRRLVRDTYLEEVMQPLDEQTEQSGAFSRSAYFNYNAVTSRYEYTSIDTRAPQLMVERSAPSPKGATPSELKLQGSEFLAPTWGSAKNVKFSYRLTLGMINNNQQIVRLYLTPRTKLPKTEFLAFEYVYTKKE